MSISRGVAAAITLPFAVILFGSATPAVAQSPSAPQRPQLIDEPCNLPLADPAIAARLRCARLHVPRDPARPEAGRFELAVAIRRSAQPKAGATPVLFLHGGPGGGATAFWGLGARDPAPGHDYVAFDMRGGGRSTPRVCDDTSADLLRGLARARDDDDARTNGSATARQCLDAWRAAGFDGPQFGTERNVADAEALREALGVPRWLLLGESYGTTVAAHYVATHPDRIEAAVLDSLYPPDEMILPVPEMQGRLVDRIAADCARDAACAARFPGFGRAALASAVAALDADPVLAGGDAQRLRLDGAGLRRLLMAAAADEAGARAIPLLLDAVARRDVARLEGPLRALSSGAGGGGNFAALAATDCRDRARHHAAGAGDDPMQLLTGLPSSICGDWATPGEAPRWPWGTTVPMLLLAGGYDSFQPATAEVAGRIGPSAHLLEVPVASHGVRGAGPCVRDIVGRWLAAPGGAPDASCLAGMAAPPFLRDVVPLPGVAALATAASPPPAAVVMAAGVLLALLAGFGAPLVARLRRRSASKTRAPRAAALAVLLLVLAIAVPAAALAGAGDSMRAIGLFGLPAPAGLAAWLAWPAAALALLALYAALRERRAAAGIASISVLGAIGSAAMLGLLPVP